ncbi:1-acyl-sn-glycerol-3-phosphate acyltransferase [Endozoicomonas sp. Mp262]|uniref:1-acyl-sn-glycerol-3-phosphate acyltransferase n=1 Tax=Endozoicomonas sp. Mp262 TaxID=2919499 RepID=UPI0021D7D447
MRVTLYNTPVVSHLLVLLAKIFLHLTGWKVNGPPPRVARYIIIGAPHTSRWDFIFGIAIALKCKIRCHWLGSSALFWGPFGIVLRWLGGIPVNRKRKNSLVNQTVCAYKQHHQLGIVICPEGGMNKGERWHTGFYHIARNAEIPIIPGYLDFNTKTGGFGSAIKPSCNMSKDMAEIEAFYANIYGKFPESFSPVNSNAISSSG